MLYFIFFVRNQLKNPENGLEFERIWISQPSLHSPYEIALHFVGGTLPLHCPQDCFVDECQAVFSLPKSLRHESAQILQQKACDVLVEKFKMFAESWQCDEFFHLKWEVLCNRSCSLSHSGNCFVMCF